jgi:toxin-antitoxin system PIN domain toxin
VIVDANLLLYARNSSDGRSARARRFLETALNGPVRVGLPWMSLTAFLRIATHPRVFPRPLTPEQAGDQVREWLAAPAAWVPSPGEGYADVLTGLLARHRVTGALVRDAALAALAIEHGTGLWSTDGDFARFTGLHWEDPLAEGS